MIMKRIFTSIILATIAVASSFAQSTDPDKMIVNLKDGTSVEYLIDNIESLTFTKPGEEAKAACYKIEIPTDFSTGAIQKVMAGDKQVAEICLEYIRSWGETDNAVDQQLTVVYPMGEDGKADLSKGLAVNGAKIVWDTENDSIASYTPAADETTLTVVYLNKDGQFVSEEEAGDITETTQEAYLLKDVRGKFSSETYKVVKVGTQYWMASNLKATAYADGTAIPLYTSTQYDEWADLKTGAYHKYADDDDFYDMYGAMYNVYAVKSENGLAPEGWQVTRTKDWNDMMAYLKNSTASKVKSDDDWQKVGTNITGLGITPGGYFLTTMGTGDDYMGTRMYYWNSDIPSTKTEKEGQTGVTYIVNSIIPNSYMHGSTYGHYVRCIRK